MHSDGPVALANPKTHLWVAVANMLRESVDEHGVHAVERGFDD